MSPEANNIKYWNPSCSERSLQCDTICVLCWFVDKRIEANGFERKLFSKCGGEVLRKNANTKHVSKLNHYKQMNLIHPWAFNFLVRLVSENRPCVCGRLLISILHSNKHKCSFKFKSLFFTIKPDKMRHSMRWSDRRVILSCKFSYVNKHYQTLAAAAKKKKGEKIEWIWNFDYLSISRLFWPEENLKQTKMGGKEKKNNIMLDC